MVDRCLLFLLATTASVMLAALPVRAQEQSDYGMATGPAVGSSGGRFEGSVPTEKLRPGTMVLPLARAIELGLANNLGLLLSREGVASAKGQRWVELSKLLPNLSAGGSVHRLQESLAITGITLPGVPAVVGPFNYYDARVFLNQRLFDLEAIKRSRAAGHQVAAEEFSLKDARELVVAAVGTAYLEALSGSARVETIGAQVVTARTILERAVEMHKAGVIPGLDELRARIELLTRSQQQIVAQNDFAKQKLSLLRMIGIPGGQEVALSDGTPYPSVTVEPVEQAVSRALAAREDYRAAQSLLKSAEASSQAAHAQRLPSLVLDADYGYTGLTASSMHDTFHIVGSIRIPIFEGGKIHGDVLTAEAAVRQRRAELADLGSRIEFEVRSSLLDLASAANQVQVAKEALRLAEQSLYQAQERFSAGINDNLAVVQAQQSVAIANETLISSNYQLNLAKLMLARAEGVAEEGAAGSAGGM
jgi:outer membrane protein TolC